EVAAALAGSSAGALAAADESAPAPTVEERLAVAVRHVDLALADRGEAVGVREMRKHLAWYLRGLPGARARREQVNHATRREELLAAISYQPPAAVSNQQSASGRR